MQTNNEYTYRREIKYRINGGTYHLLRQRFAAVMSRDDHARNGTYRVTSLYFDDVYGTAYRDKVNGVLKRKKYRIRAYDLGKDVIHLEEKIKHDNVGYKKSIPLTFEEYNSLLAGDYGFLADEKFADTSGGVLCPRSSSITSGRRLCTGRETSASLLI